MVIITEDLCKSCGYCIQFCPKNVLVFSEKRNKKGFFYPVVNNADVCTSCAICATMCPDAAIELVQKEEQA